MSDVYEKASEVAAAQLVADLTPERRKALASLMQVFRSGDGEDAFRQLATLVVMLAQQIEDMQLERMGTTRDDVRSFMEENPEMVLKAMGVDP